LLAARRALQDCCDSQTSDELSPLHDSLTGA
jgi:hypothetical protein